MAFTFVYSVHINYNGITITISVIIRPNLKDLKPEWAHYRYSTGWVGKT